MKRERHARIKEIFLKATARPPDEWPALLDRYCGDDQELREGVERLLAHHDEQTITPVSQVPTSPAGVPRDAGEQIDQDDDRRPVGVHTVARRHPVFQAQALEPGTLVGGRYRIVSRLGQGGMGVVYRADDLTLGQTIALKFLNPAMAMNPEWLARFRNEARMAREVTHPSVCRMFDIGEADGTHFLSMEYVDGEDLDSLLRRIGRLSGDKAVDVARQLCVGLAAAHGVGVLHRDLKPANVMIDGRGQVRITDFGLAALPEDIRTGDIRSGTPAYMAPEQIAGLEVTVQSDLYSLGLVLYEMFGGTPAFEAGTNEEYKELHEHTCPKQLSDIVDGLDPDVSRIVARCLEKSAKDRPRSALEVAAALPGGNLLAAALAANQTPSPEMVADAAPQTVRSTTPIKFLAVVISLLAGLVVVRGIAPAPWAHADAKPPAVLADYARNLLKQAGYSVETSAQAFGFCNRSDIAPLSYGYGLRGNKVHALSAPADDPVFWYRQSPEKLVPSNIQNIVVRAARVTPSDPAPGVPGMISVAFDLSGKLLLFAAIPQVCSTGDEPLPSRGSVRWDMFFHRANLDPKEMIAHEATSVSLYPTDQRAAWRAPLAATGGSRAHVEALALHGRPLFFQVGWSDPNWTEVQRLRGSSLPESMSANALRIVFLVLTFFAVPAAWRNYTGGRSDLRGALRLAILVGTIQFSTWLLRARHTSDIDAELFRLCFSAVYALGVATLLGLFYVALEPYARRYWPEMLITWSRALSLRLRDPIVGQHILLGVLIGCSWALVAASERALVIAVGWEARPSPMTDAVANNLLEGRLVLAGYFHALLYAMFRALLFLLLLAALRALLRRPLLAALIAGLIIALIVVPRGAPVLTSWLAFGIGGVAVGVWVMIRYGLLALTVAIYVAFVLNASPVTLDPGSWHADLTLYVLALVAAIAIYGYGTARSASVAR